MDVSHVYHGNGAHETFYIILLVNCKFVLTIWTIFTCTIHKQIIFNFEPQTTHVKFEDFHVNFHHVIFLLLFSLYFLGPYTALINFLNVHSHHSGRTFLPDFIRGNWNRAQVKQAKNKLLKYKNNISLRLSGTISSD